MSIHKSFAIILLGTAALSLAKATPIYAASKPITIKASGNWSINVNKIVSDGCNQGEAPGEDEISVKQTGAKITFTDLGGSKFKGKATATKFSGTTKSKIGDITLTTSIEFSKIKGNSAKQVIYNSSATTSDGRTCLSTYSGRGKRR